MRAFLDQFDIALPWLHRMGFARPVTAHRNWVAIAQRGVPLDLLADLQRDFEGVLPHCADPDRALNNFERMLEKVRSPLSMLTFLARKQNSLAMLLRVLAASQYFSELMIQTPEYFDYLWERGHDPFDPTEFRQELLAEFAAVGWDLDRVLTLLRLRRQRELLRIGFRDIALGEPLEPITLAISDLADVMVDAALRAAWRGQVAKHGVPRASNGEPIRLAAIGLGKLGGRELNYSSDIDLIFVHDADGRCDGRRGISAGEFCDAVVRELVRLLTLSTRRGHAYRVDLRLRPHGTSGPLSLPRQAMLEYYDKFGRTWERQTLIKARPCAGCAALGRELIEDLAPFVHRRYLGFVEINEIKSLKRKIEAKTRDRGTEALDLKTGQGGIRDIEFTVQFLQLLHGHALPDLREPNTLTALHSLARHGCINSDEHAAMETAYRFLRKAEHRLQFMFDRQCHVLPREPQEQRHLAARLGYPRGVADDPAESFLQDLRQVTQQSRATLDRLLHDRFTEATPGMESAAEPETDLILDPAPAPDRIRDVLSRFHFHDVVQAYARLMALAEEEVPFLSSPRCRHFLASAAPALLRALGESADPDQALANLERVTASLGAKGVLWESFSLHPSMLRLYVQLCSWSRFLCDLLIKNPGSIDELLDALLAERAPARAELIAELERLLKGARDIDPILHSFKNRRLLEIGIRDILGRSSLRETLRWLADVADAVLGAVVQVHWRDLTEQHGMPWLTGTDQPARFVLLGLGKFGGQELAYHADLDLVYLYEGEGRTPAGMEAARFHVALAQRLAGTLSRPGPLGKLYPVDFRLRPQGKSGPLVVSMDRFIAHYRQNRIPLWERQALTRARVVAGPDDLTHRIRGLLESLCHGAPWRPAMLDELAEMRQRLEASRHSADLKRGVGGVADIEFAVQLIQLKYAARYPGILHPNLWEALERIEQTGLWSPARTTLFREGYSKLRAIENRLGLVRGKGTNELPQDPAEQNAFAERMGHTGADAGQRQRDDLARLAGEIRREFLQTLADER